MLTYFGYSRGGGGGGFQDNFGKFRDFLSDNSDMCHAQLSRVFRRLNMLPVSCFQNFLCPGSDDGSSSNNSGRWNVSKVYSL